MATPLCMLISLGVFWNFGWGSHNCNQHLQSPSQGGHSVLDIAVTDSCTNSPGSGSSVPRKQVHLLSFVFSHWLNTECPEAQGWTALANSALLLVFWLLFFGTCDALWSSHQCFSHRSTPHEIKRSSVECTTALLRVHLLPGSFTWPPDPEVRQ